MKKLFLFIILIFSLFSKTLALDSLITPQDKKETKYFLKNIYFNDNFTSSHILYNITSLEKNHYISPKDIENDIYRLYQEKIFRNIRSSVNIENDSVELTYLTETSPLYKILPQVHLSYIADTNLSSISLSANMIFQNIMGLNNIINIYLENNMPLVLVNNYQIKKIYYKYYNLSLNISNENLTNKNFIFSVGTQLFSKNSYKLFNDEMNFLNIFFGIGKKLTPFQKIESGIINKRTKYIEYFVDGNDSNSFKKNNVLFLNYQYNKYDYRYLTNNKTFLKIILLKYGIEPNSTENFFKFNSQFIKIKKVFNFRIFERVNIEKISNIKKISPENYLYSGGEFTNRGFNTNSLPYFYYQSKKIGGTLKIENSIDLRKFIFKIGPFNNFWANKLTSLFEIAIFFDYTYLANEIKNFNQSYYSYGIGTFIWPLNFEEYAGLYFSFNNKNRFNIALTTSLGF